MVTVTILLWGYCVEWDMQSMCNIGIDDQNSQIGMGEIWFGKYKGSKVTKWIYGPIQSIIKMLKWPCYNDLKLCYKVSSCSKKMVASIYHYIFNLKLFPCNVVFHLINCIFFIICLSCLWVAQNINIHGLMIW